MMNKVNYYILIIGLCWSSIVASQDKDWTKVTESQTRHKQSAISSASDGEDQQESEEETVSEKQIEVFGRVVESDDYNEISEVPTQEEVDQAKTEIERLFPGRFLLQNTDSAQSVLNRYSHIDPTGLVPDDLLQEALVFFDSNSGFTNRRYITIVDYSKPSWKKRLFIIRMDDGVVYARHVGHGKNSDPNHDGYLDYYSNQSGSYKSSKGFYRAAEIYWSSNQNIGRALKLDGLSSTNSNARSRGIVFHGSSYVADENVIQGRSLGCVTISWNKKDEIIDLLTGGSLLYVNNSGS